MILIAVFGGGKHVEDFEELDELPTAMAILDQRVHLTGEQVDASHQGHCAMALVFVITLDGGVGAGYWSQIVFQALIDRSRAPLDLKLRLLGKEGYREGAGPPAPRDPTPSQP